MVWLAIAPGPLARLHVTPLLVESFATVAVMVTLCPWSSAWVAPEDRVTAIGAGAELAPQPDINTKTNKEYRSVFFIAPSR